MEDNPAPMARSPRGRQPLSEAADRINRSPVRPARAIANQEQVAKADIQQASINTSAPSQNPVQLSATTEPQSKPSRDPEVTTASILQGASKRKTHVGPWQLGKTLGKGATGRVRLARHAVTGQIAAVKIVSRRGASMVNSESIVAMDRNAGALRTQLGPRAIPFGIEREVVIMKLIEHPNVINLYDVWENRGELYRTILSPFSPREHELTTADILFSSTSKEESSSITYQQMALYPRKKQFESSARSFPVWRTATGSTSATVI